VKANNRLHCLTNLVYWYGSYNNPQNAYSLLTSNKMISYENAVKKGYLKVPNWLQKKLDANQKITAAQDQLLRGLEEMREDLEKDPKDRRGRMPAFIESWELDSEPEDEEELSDKEEPIGVKDGKGLLPIEHAFQADSFGEVNLNAKYDPKCLALQACQCPLTQIDGCTDCNDKHPLMTRIRESGRSSISHEKLLNILRFLNSSLAVTHHPDDVHKILQLEDFLASEKQHVKDLKQRLDDFENTSNGNNERLESQKERNHNLKTAHATLKAQVTEMQQRLDSEKQRNQTHNTEYATLQAQATEIQQQLDDNERKTRKQIDGLLSLLVETGSQVIESCTDLPIPNLKYLIKILCRRLDTLLLSDGGDDRKPSCAQSLGAYLVEDENASKDMLMQCIQNLFLECTQAEGSDLQDAAGQYTTTARAQTPGAARRKRNDNSSDHQGGQDDAAGSISRTKRARVCVKREQI
jgi:predicted transcriptional regulator